MEAFLSKLKSIQMLKIKLHKLKILLSLESTEDQVGTLNQYIKEMTHEIRFQEDQLESQKPENFEFCIEIIDPAMEGHLSQAYYKDHERWYFARIKKVDFDEQKISLDFIGYDEECVLESYQVKIPPQTPDRFFIKGCKITYLDDESGKLKLGSIEEANSKKWTKVKDEITGNVLQIERGFVLNPDIFFVKARNQDGSLKIPDRLQINPNDTKAERLFKKKKIKKIKFEEKTKEINSFFNGKKDTWQQFQKSMIGGGKGIVGGLKK